MQPAVHAEEKPAASNLRPYPRDPRPQTPDLQPSDKADEPDLDTVTVRLRALSVTPPASRSHSVDSRADCALETPQSRKRTSKNLQKEWPPKNQLRESAVHKVDDDDDE